MNRIIDPIVRETHKAYEAMMANEAALDECVAAFIHAHCKQEGILLRRISRCGTWYLEEIGGKLLQCCIVRLYHGPRSRPKATVLREYAIQCGDITGEVIELFA